MSSNFSKKRIPKTASNIKTIYVYDFSDIPSHIKWINENRVCRINTRKFPGKLIHVDFSRSRFLKPYHIAPLACLIHEYHANGYKIQLKNIPEQIRDYLTSFNFNQFCLNTYNNNFPEPTDSKIFPLWRIEQNAISLFPNRVQRYFENNHFDGKSLFSLSVSLSELMNNIFDHSGSTIPGYTFTQYNSRTSSIITCVCDFGIGIPNKVNEYLKIKGNKCDTDLVALKKSFEHSFSTQSMPHNRGFGWENIFSNIRDLNSKLLILSNHALYWQMSDGSVKDCVLDVNFPGTLVVIWLDTNNLPAHEEELTDELHLL